MQVYGSLTNRIDEQRNQKQPAVGMGATITMWTDRHAATIVKVTAHQVHVQQDKATRTDTNGMSECQEYTYERDPSRSVQIFRRTKHGWRERAGNGLVIGERDEYYDFSF